MIIIIIINVIYFLYIVLLEWKYFDVLFIFVFIYEVSLIDVWNNFVFFI